MKGFHPWPFFSFPIVVDIDGTRFNRVQSDRPGIVAEYEEERGTRRIFVAMRNGKPVYNFDEHRQTFAGMPGAFRL
jgi:hypothetical protein